MIKYIKGDLMKQTSDYDIVIHGCNCFKTMGAGIANQVRTMFPHAYEVDYNTKLGDPNKLGSFAYYDYPNFTLINAYTQFGCGLLERIDNEYLSKEQTQELRERAIKKCFSKLYDKYGNQHHKFAFPLIGAGLAGGNWNRISKIIEQQMPNEDLTCIIWEHDITNLKLFNLYEAE